MRRFFFLLLLTLLAAAAVAQELPEGTPAALGEAPTIDGTLEEGEWDDATRIELETTWIWLKHDGESLYIGLRGQTRSFGNVCVMYGEQVYMLRASDGIGTAIYDPAGAGWSPKTQFGAKLRQKATNKAIQAKRDEYFEAWGWIANNRNTGKLQDMEYRISLGLIGIENPKVAITYTDREHTKETSSWPTDLDDGCLHEAVLRGATPSQLAIDPDSWATIILE